MALVEATNDYFEELLELIVTNIEPNKEFSKSNDWLYREVVGTEPDPTKAEGLLNDAYLSFAGTLRSRPFGNTLTRSHLWLTALGSARVANFSSGSRASCLCTWLSPSGPAMLARLGL